MGQSSRNPIPEQDRKAIAEWDRNRNAEWDRKLRMTQTISDSNISKLGKLKPLILDKKK